ncbi:helix-turn-helix domain-containing protein [Fusibacter ferrireducens]|uniref:Helix-turn-helix transcriptional regulator n=1 Tax=Fusibacter ferrireducens TaxID=2785058 RepID=A0ABR9ZQZ7_9FIRM|nr:helix-turn-helix transcriptional regulator [Fusibacter ferrireducens]MBF4692875.1 helix-turn-helix transcriptional regulator [Fusibacter ferrireducens]
MFASYNLIDFGNRLKEIRKNQGISQAQVRDIVGLNEDTLRKIEHGNVLPRYDTLELMSLVYKEDLLKLLQSYRVNQTLNDLYECTDKIITAHIPEDLEKIKEQLVCFKAQNQSTNMLYNALEIEQFELFLASIHIYFEGNIVKRNKAFEYLQEALNKTLTGFSPFNFKKFKYNFFEIRILLLLGTVLYDVKQETLSNQILEFCLKYLLQNFTLEEKIQKLVIKIYNNLAYNYHLSNQHKKVIQVADDCIAFSLSHNNLYGLANIYYRKGISAYRLKSDDYYDLLKKSVLLSEISGNDDLALLYRRITFEYYGILIE